MELSPYCTSFNRIRDGFDSAAKFRAHWTRLCAALAQWANGCSAQRFPSAGVALWGRSLRQGRAPPFPFQGAFASGSRIGISEPAAVLADCNAERNVSQARITLA